MGNISDKVNTYRFWGHYVKGQRHRQFFFEGGGGGGGGGGGEFTFLSLMLH